MFRSIPVSIVVLCISSFLVIGCEGSAKKKDTDAAAEQQMKDKMKERSEKSLSQAEALGKTATATLKPSGAATTQPTNNNVTGTVTFAQTGTDTVLVTIQLTGLVPESKHGFHIHEKGDLSDPELKSAGGHFNPAGHHHGGPNSPMSHAGDLGNVTADANGNVHTEVTIKGISLDPGAQNNIVGRSVILHSKEDDLKTDPSGNSGSRIAGGIIELPK